jgi:hypothetical protein
MGLIHSRASKKRDRAAAKLAEEQAKAIKDERKADRKERAAERNAANPIQLPKIPTLGEVIARRRQRDEDQ